MFKRRWKDDIKMDLREIWFEGMVWIRMAKDGDYYLIHYRFLINCIEAKMHLII